MLLPWAPEPWAIFCSVVFSIESVSRSSSSLSSSVQCLDRWFSWASFGWLHLAWQFGASEWEHRTLYWRRFSQQSLRHQKGAPDSASSTLVTASLGFSVAQPWVSYTTYPWPRSFCSLLLCSFLRCPSFCGEGARQSPNRNTLHKSLRRKLLMEAPAWVILQRHRPTSPKCWMISEHKECASVCNQ